MEKKLPEALAAADEALRLDPKLVPALTLKAKLAMAAYRLDVARQCLEQALAIDPRAPYAQFLYGLEAYLENDMKAALPRFRKARELNPSDPRAALYLGTHRREPGATGGGDVPLRGGRSPGAFRERFARGDLAAWRKAPAFSWAGWMRASDWLAQAARLSPKSRDAHFEFARLLLEKGDAERGCRRRRERALALSDGIVTDAAIRYLLIRAYQKLGMADRAAIHAEIMRTQESPAGNTVKK